MAGDKKGNEGDRHKVGNLNDFLLEVAFSLNELYFA